MEGQVLRESLGGETIELALTQGVCLSFCIEGITGGVDGNNFHLRLLRIGDQHGGIHDQGSMGLDGLQVVVQVVVSGTDGHDLDLQVLACVFGGDIDRLAVAPGGIVVAHIQVGLAGIFLHAVDLSGSLLGVHMNLIIGPQQTVGGQTVGTIGDALGNLRIGVNGVGGQLAVHILVGGGVDVPILGIMPLLTVLSGLGDPDIFRTGDQRGRGIIGGIQNVPLVVDVEDTGAFPVDQCSLAVDQLDGVVLTGHDGVGGELQGSPVSHVVGAAVAQGGLLLLVHAAAAEEDGGLGGGGIQLALVLDLAVMALGAHVAETNALLNGEHNTVHLTGLVAGPVDVVLFLHGLGNVGFQFLQGDLALQGLVACTILDLDQRLVVGPGIALVDVLTGQRIDTVDLVGEVLHVGLVSLIGNSLKGLVQQFIIVVHQAVAPDAVKAIMVLKGSCEGNGMFVQQFILVIRIHIAIHIDVGVGELADDVALVILGQGVVPDVGLSQFLTGGPGVGQVQLGDDVHTGSCAGVVLADVVVDVLKILLVGAVGCAGILLVGDPAALGHGGAGAPVGLQVEGVGGVGDCIVGVSLDVGQLPELLITDEQTVLGDAGDVGGVGILGRILGEGILAVGSGALGGIVIVGVLVDGIAAVQQHQLAEAVDVHDLDTAVTDQILVKGSNAQVHSAGSAGELVVIHVVTVVIILVTGGAVSAFILIRALGSRIQSTHHGGLIVAAEGTAADHDIAGIHTLGSLVQDLLLLGSQAGVGFALFVGFQSLVLLTGSLGDGGINTLPLFQGKGVVADLFNLIGLGHGQGDILDHDDLAVLVQLVHITDLLLVHRVEVEHIGAGIGGEGAIKDIHHAAHGLAVAGIVLGNVLQLGVVEHLDNCVTDIGGRAVANEVAAVDDHGTLVAHAGNGTMNTGGGTGLLVLGKEVIQALANLECLLHHACDLILVKGSGGDTLVQFVDLGILVILGGLLVILLVVGGLVALLVLIGLLVVVSLLLGDGLILLAVLLCSLSFRLVTGGGGGIVLVFGSTALAVLLLVGAVLILGFVIAILGIFLTRRIKIGNGILLQSHCSRDAGGILKDGGAQGNGFADNLFQGSPAEAGLELILLTASLILAAVDDQITIIHQEDIPVGVVPEVPLLMVDHVAVGVDTAGGLFLVVGQLKIGVSDHYVGAVGIDDGQGSALADLEHVGHVIINGAGLIAAVSVALVVHLDGMTVQIENLIGFDLDRRIVAVFADGGLQVFDQDNVLVIGVLGLQVLAEFAAGSLIVALIDLPPLEAVAGHRIDIFVAPVVLVVQTGNGGAAILTDVGHGVVRSGRDLVAILVIHQIALVIRQVIGMLIVHLDIGLFVGDALGRGIYHDCRAFILVLGRMDVDGIDRDQTQHKHQRQHKTEQSCRE